MLTSIERERDEWQRPSEILQWRHELRLGAVADEIKQSGFEIVARDDLFIDRPGDDGIWWLIVALKR